MTKRPPAHLKPRGPGRAFWNDVVRDYELDAADWRLLEAACIALDRAEAARELIDRTGVVLKGPRGGVHANPACSVERAATRAFLQAVRQLGLEPEEAQPRSMRGRFTSIEGGRRGA